MEKTGEIEGLVLFANAYTAVVLTGNFDEDGFHSNGIVDLKHGGVLCGKERLHPGDWIETEINVIQHGSEKDHEILVNDIASQFNESGERDLAKKIIKWLAVGIDYEKKIQDALKMPCFGELDYNDSEWRKQAKEKKYPCQVLSGCSVSEECYRKNSELKKQKVPCS